MNRSDAESGGSVSGQTTNNDGLAHGGLGCASGQTTNNDGLPYEGVPESGRFASGQTTKNDGLLYEGRPESGRFASGQTTKNDGLPYEGVPESGRFASGQTTKNDGLPYEGVPESGRFASGQTTKNDGLPYEGVPESGRFASGQTTKNDGLPYEGVPESGRFASGQTTKNDGLPHGGVRESGRFASGQTTKNDGLPHGGVRAVVRIAILILLVGGGYVAGRWHDPPRKAERKVLYWQDPMHPAYKSDKPGIAPDCGMALEPVYAEPPAAAVPQPPGTIQISAEKQQMIGVKFGTAEYTSVGETLRAVGKIAIDETRVVRVHPKIEGWIEKVFVDFMGAPIKKGDPLVTVYSPEMLASEKEYLLAVKAREVMQDGDSIVEASRKRLELWDLSLAQIEDLESTRKPTQSITIYSPANGFVTARNSFANQRITPESELYAITDLSRVWVMADLFENDIAKIRVGQPAMVKMPYANGGEFLAHVDNVQPQVDPQTRTVKARLEVSNPGMKLRPDMFVDVEFTIGGTRQLTVPADAVLNAGSRQTVFIDRGNGYLEPRAVETGDQIEDRIVITRGLKEGERIVTSANFLIDSESQLKAK